MKKTMMNKKDAPKKTTPKSDFIVNESYDKLLEALGWLYYARCDQLTRLYYLPGSLTLIRERLRTLIEHKYVSYLSLISDGKNTRRIYALDGRGVSYLKDTGRIPEERYFRPSDVERSPFFLPHTLDVGDLMIAFALLAREDTRFQIVTRRHELDLKREKREEAHKVRILRTIGDKVVERNIYIYPDGFILLSMLGDDGKLRKFGVWLEIDRGTEMDNAKFKDRVRGIYAYYFTKSVNEDGKKSIKVSDAYIQKYGTSNLLVAYLVTQGGKQRMNHLCDLAQQELASTNEKAKIARIFRFAVAPQSWDFVEPETKTGKPIDVIRTLLFTPVWRVPFEGHELVPLVRVT